MVIEPDVVPGNHGYGLRAILNFGTLTGPLPPAFGGGTVKCGASWPPNAGGAPQNRR
jgi:hypothetical protein